MALAAPFEARWVRPEPRYAFLAHQLGNAVKLAFPGRRVTGVQPLTEGLRNANFKVHLDSPDTFAVLRFYERDPALCAKEVSLLGLLGPLIPVPEVTFAQPVGLGDLPPFVAWRFVEGVSLRELKRTAVASVVAQAAFASGQILARVHRMIFQRSGWIGPALEVTEPFPQTTDSLPRLVEQCLASQQLRERMDPELRDRFQALIWAFATQFADLGRDRSLVHGDFGKRNQLVRRSAGKWTVAAILDWEFAIAGSPLIDIGHFLRYERFARPLLEPAFSSGYLEAGGTLPNGWRRLARLLDTISLCESLTHDLPPGVSGELVWSSLAPQLKTVIRNASAAFEGQLPEDAVFIDRAPKTARRHFRDHPASIPSAWRSGPTSSAQFRPDRERRTRSLGGSGERGAGGSHAGALPSSRFSPEPRGHALL